MNKVSINLVLYKFNIILGGLLWYYNLYGIYYYVITNHKKPTFRTKKILNHIIKYNYINLYRGKTKMIYNNCFFNLVLYLNSFSIFLFYIIRIGIKNVITSLSI